MCKNVFKVIFLALICKVSFSNPPPSYSQKLAENFTHAYGELLPEKASFIGFTEFDGKVSKIGADFDAEMLIFYHKWLHKLKTINTEKLSKDDAVDIKILSKYIEDNIHEIQVNHQGNIIPFIPGSETVLENLNKLSKSQYNLARKKAALRRFHEYVNSDYLLHAQEYMLAAINKYSSSDAVYPCQREVQNYLNNSQDYVKSTQKLLEKFHNPFMKNDFKKYSRQVAEFDRFIRSEILPKARQKPGITPDVYKMYLNNYGIENVSFEEMISRGKQDFAKVYKEYQVLAEIIAKKYHLSKNSPTDVIKFLKQSKVTSPGKILRLYQKESKELDKLIRDNQLITLPISPLKIRLSSLTESKMHPAPRIIIPPRINPQGIVPVFVVPISAKGLPYDDFTYPAINIALLAHEGRPGHDLHFRNIYTGNINLIRSYYAKHSVESEGWALYAEDMVYPFVGVEEKFGILQLRLQRIARYFLDPLVQLNKISKDEVIAILHNKVGLSEAFSEVEYKRYVYLSPGQAPSYYFGLLKIQNLKAHLTKRYGSLNEKCFNDTLLSFGMIPIKYVYEFEGKFKQCKA